MTFAVGEDDEHPVGAILTAGGEELAPLRQDGGQTGPSFAREVGVEPVEEEAQRPTIDREGGEDVAPAREGDEAESVPLEILHQPARLAHGAAQSARGLVLGKHRAADVDREDQIERAGLGRHRRAPPARPREGAGERGSGEREDVRRPRTVLGGAGREFGRPGRSPPDPPAPGRPGEHPGGGGAERHQPEHERVIEDDEHQGTRTATVEASSSSRASAPRANSTNGLVTSSYRT